MIVARGMGYHAEVDAKPGLIPNTNTFHWQVAGRGICERGVEAYKSQAIRAAKIKLNEICQAERKRISCIS
jgi:hypothetical protein